MHAGGGMPPFGGGGGGGGGGSGGFFDDGYGSTARLNAYDRYGRPTQQTQQALAAPPSDRHAAGPEQQGSSRWSKFVAAGAQAGASGAGPRLAGPAANSSSKWSMFVDSGADRATHRRVAAAQPAEATGQLWDVPVATSRKKQKRKSTPKSARPKAAAPKAAQGQPVLSRRLPSQPARNHAGPHADGAYSPPPLNLRQATLEESISHRPAQHRAEGPVPPHRVPGREGSGQRRSNSDVAQLLERVRAERPRLEQATADRIDGHGGGAARAPAAPRDAQSTRDQLLERVRVERPRLERATADGIEGRGEAKPPAKPRAAKSAPAKPKGTKPPRKTTVDGSKRPRTADKPTKPTKRSASASAADAVSVDLIAEIRSLGDLQFVDASATQQNLLEFRAALGLDGGGPPDLVTWAFLHGGSRAFLSSFTVDGALTEAQLDNSAVGIVVDGGLQDGAQPVCFFVPVRERRDRFDSNGCGPGGSNHEMCLRSFKAMFEAGFVKVSWNMQISFRQLYSILPDMMPTNLFDPKLGRWIVDSEWKGSESGGKTGFAQACAACQIAGDAAVPSDAHPGSVQTKISSFVGELNRCAQLARQLFGMINETEHVTCVRTCVPNEMATSAILVQSKKTANKRLARLPSAEVGPLVPFAFVPSF